MRPKAPASPAPVAPTSQTSEDNAPVHTIRHRNLKASIWKNETKNGPMFKVTVVRSYKEGEEWHDTHSFAFDELMNVAKLFSDAHSFISQERAKESAARWSDLIPNHCRWNVPTQKERRMLRPACTRRAARSGYGVRAFWSVSTAH